MNQVFQMKILDFLSDNDNQIIFNFNEKMQYLPPFRTSKNHSLVTLLPLITPTFLYFLFLRTLDHCNVNFLSNQEFYFHEIIFELSSSITKFTHVFQTTEFVTIVII